MTAAILLVSSGIWVMVSTPYHARAHRHGKAWTTAMTPACWGLASAVLFGVLTNDVTSSLLAAAAVAILTGLVKARRGRSRNLASCADRSRGLPAILRVLAVMVDAGYPLQAAVESVAPIAPALIREDLAQVSAATRLGMTESQAWKTLQSKPGWEHIAADLARATHYGTPVVQLLRNHADGLVRQGHRRAEKAAKTSSTRAVFPLMVCYLPAFVLVSVVPVLVGAFSTLQA